MIELTDIFMNMMRLDVILAVTFGTLLGVIIGALPGLNGPIGVSLLLPITFSFSPEVGLLMLGGIYMGSHYGSSITAILLNAPGDVVAACTAIEGYPMAKEGRAKEALYYSIIACVVGGTIGVLTLIFFTPPLAQLALQFGNSEVFLLGFFGLLIAATMSSGENITKGLFGVIFGLLLSTVGNDLLSGTSRLDFGLHELNAGINLIPVVIGLFAISSMLESLSIKSGQITSISNITSSLTNVAKKVFIKPWLLLKSSSLGTFIGILPGAGGAIATFVAYAEAKRSSKTPEKFGKGNPEGIVSAESANNAAVGGSLVPLLALGIPGSATAAIMYGALTIHGIVPGPDLFVTRPDVAYTFIVGMLLTVIVMGIFGVLGVPLFTYILRIKLNFIIPTVLVFCIIGSYAIRNSLFDVLIAIVFGLLGFYFKKVDIPVALIVLGIILGPLIETNLRRTLITVEATDVNFFTFIFSRPISMTLIIIVALLLFSIIWTKRNKIVD